MPGVSSPFFAGSVNAPTSRTPADVYFARETNYYAGGGVIAKFGYTQVVTK
jgi:hypothetical protein